MQARLFFLRTVQGIFVVNETSIFQVILEFFVYAITQFLSIWICSRRMFNTRREGNRINGSRTCDNLINPYNLGS